MLRTEIIANLKRIALSAGLVCGLAGAPGLAQAQAQLQGQIQAPGPNLQLDAAQLHMGDPMADLSAVQVRSAALQSPLFLGEIDHTSLISADTTELVLADGVSLDLSNYLRSTRIADQPSASVALANPVALGLSGEVSLVEEVFVLEDRIIVSREATIPVSRATCRQSANQRRGGAFRGAVRNALARARSELCLQPADPQRVLRDAQQPVLLDPASDLTTGMQHRITTLQGGAQLIAPPTAADITAAAEEVRAELRQMPVGALYRHDVTVGEALRLSDAELLRLDADGEERVITHLTIIPLAREIQPAGVTSRLPEAALPQAGEGFDRAIGPRIRELPSVLQPHALTRQGQTQPRRPVQRRLPQNALRQGEETGRVSGERAMQLPPRQLETPLRVNPGLLRGERERRELQSQRITHEDSAYFITGFTLTEEIEERHKVTFNKRRNYFVAFKYRVGYRAGLRFPFSVSYETQAAFRTDADTGRWEPVYAQMDISAEGAPGNSRTAYAEAGMPAELIAGNREFTFGVWAWCQLQVRLPVVKTVRVNCPSISVPRQGRCPNWACADFTPPLGREARLASPRIPADVSGLQINAWVARAGVEPGVNVYARNARFSLRAEPLGDASFSAQPNRAQSCEWTNGRAMRGNELLSDGSCRIVFDGRSQRQYGSGSDPVMRFQLDVSDADIPGLRLSDPRYEFTMVFVPVLELFAEIDVAVASWRVDREIEIPGLSIRRDFRFDRHRGTTDAVILGGCSPLDVTAPGCSRQNGYIFSPIQTFREGDPG